MQLKETLKDLMMLPALSGYEYGVGKYMKEKFSSYADEVKCDTSGNVTAVFKSGKHDATRVMIFAHMDQLGFVIKEIDPSGFLRVERVGGIPEKILPGLEVIIRCENGDWLPGVIGNKSHHTTPADEKYKVNPYAELFIDLGFSSADEAYTAGVNIGSPIVYRPKFHELQNGICSGTSIDNRGGCAALLDIAHRLSNVPTKNRNYDVYLTATVQEEFNLRGAYIACSYIKPDFAIALDVAIANDTPEDAGNASVKLGSGPVMGMYNFHGRGTLNGTIPHPLLISITKDAAKSADIKLQRYASTGLLTDASYVQLTGNGTPVIDLAFPCRYTHSPVETCCVNDLCILSELVWAMLKQNVTKEDFIRKYD